MSTLTTKLGMSKPADNDTDWGDEIRGALDIIDAALISHYFAENAPHTGLDFAYKGGLCRKDNILITINSGTITLVDDTTNYVFIDTGTDSVSTNTTGVASGNIPLFTVITASGAISTVTDIRSLLSADVTLSHNHNSIYFTEEELESATDGSAGADLIGMTAIPDVSGATTIQSFLEALVTLLKAVTDSASGADLIGATAIDGLGEQATVQAILEALYSAISEASPLTTKGDLYVYGSADARLPVGTDGQVLTADSAQALGVKWAKPTRGICFSINNVNLAITQSVAITAPCALTITGGKIEVGTAPTGAALICDVHKNGTTLWTTQTNRPKITPVAGARTYTITTNAVAGDTVTIDTIVFTAVASGATGNQFDVGADTTATAANITTTLNANATISGKYTGTASTNTFTLTEKVSGGGNTPSVATYTGTIEISNGTATTSSAPTSTSITAPDVTSIAQGDRLLLMIDQIGSTVAGKDLSLTLYCEVV